MQNEWILNQQNRIAFVMVDAAGSEVAGIGDGNLTVQISKNGGAFAAGTGTDTEISNGWYSYLAAAAEADTIGPVAVKVTGAGAVQQNLEYVVKQRTSNAIEFTYTVTDVSTGGPIEGVDVWVTSDIGGVNIIWVGKTNTVGIAVDSNDEKPFLDAGNYYFWSQRTGYTFTNPDLETVS